MRLVLAIILGKLILFLTRNLRIGGGSAAPGLYALSVEPDLVEKIASQIPINVVITGTNGKTTTAKMLAHFAKTAGMKVIRNHTGSNLERGIASTLIQNSRLHLEGVKLNYNLGIWELDEAAFNSVAPKLKPDIIVFLNIFRDQLDRYGEINTVLKRWQETLKKTPAQTKILINGDDANILGLASSFKGHIQKFGVKNFKIVGESIVHKKEKENLDFEAINTKLKGLTGSSFQLIVNNELLTINLPLPGVYHIYDALAAIACAYHLNLPISKLADSLKNYSPAFGRVEKLPFGYVFLIKNPAGATQVFETIAPNIKPDDALLLALNDNLADGTDVSWIWDANFEVLLKAKNYQKSAGVPLRQQSSLREASEASNTIPPQGWMSIICSGTRAYDLALRLKYAGFPVNKSDVEPDMEKALKRARKALKDKLFILPTYTAMLELQSILTKEDLKKNYWEEAS